MAARDRQRIDLLLVRLAVSVGLVALVLAWVEWREVGRSWLHVDPWLLAASAGVLLFSNVMGALQWWAFLRAAGIEIRWRGALHAYFVGLFFNNFLPSGMGGDAVKVYDVGWRSGRALETLAATVADRLLGLFVLTTIAVIALFFGETAQVLARSAILVWLIFGGLFLVALLIVLPALFRPFGALLRRLPERVRSPGVSILDQLRLLIRRPALMLRLSLLSLVIQFSRVLVHALTGLALGLQLPFAVYGTVVPVLGVLVNLPSINGVGIREGGGVLLFAEAGVAPEMAVSMQLLTYVVMVLLSLSGGVLFAVGRRR